MEGARRARPDDLSACRALLADALGAAAPVRGGQALIGEHTADTLLAQWGADPDGAALFVGEFHDVVVGMSAVVVAAPAPDGRRTGRIDCCYVEPEARGVGVGTALMSAMVEWSRARGCAAIDALALPGDRATKQRLEASGFTARLLVLSRSLD